MFEISKITEFLRWGNYNAPTVTLESQSDIKAIKEDILLGTMDSLNIAAGLIGNISREANAPAWAKPLQKIVIGVRGDLDYAIGDSRIKISKDAVARIEKLFRKE